MVEVNIQNFCPIEHQLYVDSTQPAYSSFPDTDMTKKMVKIKSFHGGRMYVPEYHQAIYSAKTVGEIVTAMYRALSASGYNNFGDASPELAKKCLAKLNEAKHNTQEV